MSWVNGTHSRSDVETFYGFGEEQRHHTTFSYDVDHPLQFAAQDNGVTPVEYVLVALGGCLTAGIAAVAQQRSIQLRSVRATLAAEMDLHGILGADPDVRNGFSGVTVSYQIDADATAEEIKALVAQSQKRSAVYDIITNPTNVTVDVGLIRSERAGEDAAVPEYDHRDRRCRPLRAGHEPLPRRPFDRPRRPRTRQRWRTRGARSGGTRCGCSPRTG